MPDGTVTRTFTIITTYTNEMMAELHDRMPVILEIGGLARMAVELRRFRLAQFARMFAY